MLAADADKQRCKHYMYIWDYLNSKYCLNSIQLVHYYLNYIHIR